MTKKILKPSDVLAPVPVVMVSCGDLSKNEKNIITIAWAGTICSDPSMLSISIRPSRYSYEIISRTKEFVVNLTTRKLAAAADQCGLKTGRGMDKFAASGLTAVKGSQVAAPLIAESPVNIECRVEEIKKLGAHDMFIARVLCINADEGYVSANGFLKFDNADLVSFCNGQYYLLGEHLGTFGWSQQK